MSFSENFLSHHERLEDFHLCSLLANHLPGQNPTSLLRFSDEQLLPCPLLISMCSQIVQSAMFKYGKTITSSVCSLWSLSGGRCDLMYLKYSILVMKEVMVPLSSRQNCTDQHSQVQSWVPILKRALREKREGTKCNVVFWTRSWKRT